jgi:hypothetical protein
MPRRVMTSRSRPIHRIVDDALERLEHGLWQRGPLLAERGREGPRARFDGHAHLKAFVHRDCRRALCGHAGLEICRTANDRQMIRSPSIVTGSFVVTTDAVTDRGAHVRWRGRAGPRWTATLNCGGCWHPHLQPSGREARTSSETSTLRTHASLRKCPRGSRFKTRRVHDLTASGAAGVRESQGGSMAYPEAVWERAMTVWSSSVPGPSHLLRGSPPPAGLGRKEVAEITR